MPLVTGILAVVGAVGSFFGAGFSLGSFLLNAAVGVGLSLASRLLADKPAQQASGPRVGGVQGKLQAAGDLARSFPLGYCATAGSLVYANFWGQDGDTPNAYFTQVIAVSDLQATLASVYVNGELVTLLTGEAHADYGIPVQEYRKDGKDHLWIKYHDGTQTTADTFLSNYVASAERPWGPDRIGAGVAYAVPTALVEDTLFSGFPQFRFALNGVKLYDPSRDASAGGSGAQRWSDPSTWGGDGDDFPAVQAYNVLRGISYSGVWLYGLQGVSSAQLPNVAWINAISACRDPVEGESGLEPSYRAGMELQVGHQIGDTLDVLMTACQGRLSEIGGVYKMHAGAPGAPVVVFTDGDILSTEEQTFTPFFGLSETVNGISASHPEPAEGWNMKVAPPLLRTDLEARDGGRRLLSDIKFDAVPYAEQVQRLMKSALLEAQRARRHTYSMPPQFWLLEPGDIVGWSSARNGYIDKLFRVDGVVDKANADVILDLTEVDPSDYNFDHSSDFRPVPPVPIVFVRPAPQAVLDWYAEGAVVYDSDGLARRPAILLEWNGSVTSDIAAVQFEVREAFGGMKVVHANRMDNVAAGATLISQNLLPNQNYQVRGRYIPANPRETLWSDWIAVITPDVSLSIYDFGASLKYQMRKLQDLMQSQIDDLKAKLKATGNQDARNWLDKKEIRGQIAARFDKSYALVEQVQTVAVNTQQALASYTITTNARVAEIETSVTIVQESVADISGWAASQYAVRLDRNGHVLEFGLFNGGPGTGTATFRVDKFELFLNGVGNKAPFVLGTINGTATFGFSGNMLLDGIVNAWHIAAGSINAGHIQAGVIDATHIKQNGVTLDNIIANAMAKVYTTTFGSAIALPYATAAPQWSAETTLLDTGAFNVPAFATLNINGTAYAQSGGAIAGFGPSGSIYFKAACEGQLVIRIYVNGIIVNERSYKPNVASAYWRDNRADDVPMVTNYTAPLVVAVGVPAGSYRVQVRALWLSSVGTQPPTFSAGGITVQVNNKTTLN